MPSIWNIANSNNINNKKLSSKLTFDVGEKFSGKIVKTGENNKEVKVKLLDGWQFVADIDGEVDELSQGLTRFEVEGFENGKLKLKIVNDKSNEDNTREDVIESFLEGEGLSKDDSEFLIKMIKHNMPLLRENVLRMKGIINFQDKLVNNPDEGSAFIEKYLLSKGVDGNSEEGKNISKLLKEFLKEFSSLTEDDVFIFMENNIDLTKENIESYQKLFKEKGTLYKELKSVGNEIEKLFDSLGIKSEQTVIDESGQASSKINNYANIKDIVKEVVNNTKNFPIDNVNHNKEIKLTDNDMKNSSINEINHSNEPQLKDNNISANNRINFKKEDQEQSTVVSLEDKIKLNYDKTTRANVLQNIYSSGNNNKINMLQLLKALTADETDVIKYVFQDVLSKKPQLDNVPGRELLNRFVNLGDKTILSGLKEIAEKNGVGLKELQQHHMEQALSKYFGKDIQLNEKEFNKIQDTIKYLIKTNFIEENADTTPKQVVVKGQNINETQGVVKEGLQQPVKDKVVVNNDIVKKEGSQETSKESLNETISESSIIINGEKLEDNVTLKAKDIINIKGRTSQQLVKEQIKEKSNEIKTVIKDILNNINKGDTQLSEKIFQVIKNNINDFKVFNTISNEYYYMDLPLNFNEQNYPCKVIVKDDRKNGKIIDSTNVKMVVSVETINIGVVDGYLKVRDKNIWIDMKCEETFVEPLNLGKVKLENSLKSLGYDTHIYVTKRVEQAELNNCRDFFNDNNISNIDRKV